MPQIIKEFREPSTSERFGQAFSNLGQAAGQAIPQFLQQSEQREQLKKENQAAKKLGIDLTDIYDPKMRQKALEIGLQGAKEENLLQKKQNFISNLFKKNPVSKGEELAKGSEGNQELDQQNFSPIDISDEDIITAETLGIKGLREAKDASLRKIEGNRKKFETDREFHSKRSDPIIEEAENVMKVSPIEQGLIDQQRRDIESGNTSGILPYLVDKLGLEAYRNPESARFKTASKQRFVESLHELGGAGARPNQFIEQQLVAAQAGLGRDAESNLSVLDLEQFVKDMKNQRAQFISDLSEKDRQEFGYVKSDVGQRANKLMENYSEKRQDQMAYQIRNRHEEKLSDEQLIQEIISGKVPNDTPLTVRVARILMIKNNDDERKATAEARKLGFKIPKE